MINIGYMVYEKNQHAAAAKEKTIAAENGSYEILPQSAALQERMVKRDRCMTAGYAKMRMGKNWRLKARIQGVRLSRTF